MKLSLHQKKTGIVFYIATGVFFFLSVLNIHTAPFAVECDVIAENIRINNALAVCGDAIVCGNLTVNGMLNYKGIGILTFSANDLGLTTCQQTNLTFPNVWVQNAYDGCVGINQFSEIRGVPLYTFGYAQEVAALNKPTLPYLDFSVPTDLDTSGVAGMEVDLHFFTQCSSGTTPDDVLNSGPECAADPATGAVNITMIADFIADAGIIGTGCGELEVIAVKPIVSSPSNTNGRHFNHYVVTFCISAAQVQANINPGDWARLMWYRTLDPQYEYTVFLGPVEVRYPQATLPCPLPTECPLAPVQ